MEYAEDADKDWEGTENIEHSTLNIQRGKKLKQEQTKERRKLSRISRKGRSPAEPEIRNPKSEIRNKFKKMEISKMDKEGPGNFFAACEQIGLLQCKGRKANEGSESVSIGVHAWLSCRFSFMPVPGYQPSAQKPTKRTKTPGLMSRDDSVSSGCVLAALRLCVKTGKEPLINANKR